jgi:hypothetical protein
MNIAEIETPILFEAKVCGCKNNERAVSYHFIESTHSLCIGKRELILSQLQACVRLLKYTKDKMDSSIIEKEILELKLILGQVHY